MNSLQNVPYFHILNKELSQQEMPDTAPIFETEQEQDVESVIQEPAKVVLFNDEVHTFEEVIGQIIKATGCDTTKAEALTWEVHNAGKAMVFEGEMTKCVQVSAVLEEIDLMTQIEV
jgi:ATP-dependent Clp protease adapter protein ClpS